MLPTAETSHLYCSWSLTFQRHPCGGFSVLPVWKICIQILFVIRKKSCGAKGNAPLHYFNIIKMFILQRLLTSGSGAIIEVCSAFTATFSIIQTMFGVYLKPTAFLLWYRNNDSLKTLQLSHIDTMWNQAVLMHLISDSWRLDIGCLYFPSSWPTTLIEPSLPQATQTTDTYTW